MTVNRDTGSRADARRNRARILEAAHNLFATQGLSVPLDEIAQAAGVGAGTVYRHFPSKNALFDAVMTRRISSLTAEAAHALTLPDPAVAFYGFVSHMMENAVTNESLCTAMSGQKEWQEAADVRMREQLEAHLRTLLSRAQAAGAVREDVDVTTVTALVPAYVAMVNHLRGNSDEDFAAHTGHVVEVLWEGLRAPRTDAVIPRPLLTTKRNSTEFRYESRADKTKRHGTLAADTVSLCADTSVSLCEMCQRPINAAEIGRPPRYCSSACRQRAHRRRVAAGDSTRG